MPRVIAGICGGIPLLAPKGDKTRPTADKVKESLFSILQSQLEEASFLDLFAGSGQMGIEAVSRGAARAILVDASRDSHAVISKNLEKTRLSAAVSLHRGDVFRNLASLGQKKESFDIVFMDPPYASAVSFAEKAGRLIAEMGILREEGLFIVEHRTEDTLPENVMNLTLFRRCKYGGTMLTFYTDKDYGRREVPEPSANDDFPGELRSLHSGAYGHSDEGDGVL